jgi:RimJ/RimL family protein N-acetyltransferase
VGAGHRRGLRDRRCGVGPAARRDRCPPLGGEDDGPEVGYWLEREARGRGVATRALRLVVDWACRELGVRLLLQADVRNAASRRVAEKAQFHFVREAEAPDGCGDCETVAVYELTP